jgi:hypothetical protein
LPTRVGRARVWVRVRDGRVLAADATIETDRGAPRIAAISQAILVVVNMVAAQGDALFAVECGIWIRRQRQQSVQTLARD